MKSFARSQSARRRAAATAAIASVGAGILGTHSAEAAIVPINIGPTGFNIDGVNAGLPLGFGSTSRANFPTSGSGGLSFENSEPGRGVKGTGGLTFATDTYYTPHNFAGGAAIGSSFGGMWSGGAYRSFFRYSGKSTPNFGSDNYLGFKTAQGNYGWLKSTWDGTNFQFYSAAYESVAGVAIQAGNDGFAAAVPEIDPSGLASALSLVMGSAAMLEQRRRKRAAVAAVTVTA